MNSVLRRLQWSIEHRGLAATLRATVKNVGRHLRPPPERPPHPFDVAHGTDTDGLIVGADLASGHPSDRFIEGYSAAPSSRLRNILARWQASNPPHALAEYTFVDLGCGKGRAVLLASELGFREVVGVELNPALAAIAQANSEAWIAAGKARCPIRVEHGDAAEFSWPDGPCVVFLFNPFGAAVMRRVVAAMLERFRISPADLEILYYKPEQADALAGAFEMIWREAIHISPEDLDVETAADPNDETSAYRLRRN